MIIVVSDDSLTGGTAGWKSQASQVVGRLFDVFNWPIMFGGVLMRRQVLGESVYCTKKQL